MFDLPKLPELSKLPELTRASEIATASEIAGVGLKSMLASRTIWSSLVGLGCLLASVLGVNTQLIDQGALAEALLQAATGISLAGAIVFRVLADRKLKR